MAAIDETVLWIAGLHFSDPVVVKVHIDIRCRMAVALQIRLGIHHASNIHSVFPDPTPFVQACLPGVAARRPLSGHHYAVLSQVDVCTGDVPLSQFVPQGINPDLKPGHPVWLPVSQGCHDPLARFHLYTSLSLPGLRSMFIRPNVVCELWHGVIFSPLDCSRKAQKGQRRGA